MFFERNIKVGRFEFIIFFDEGFVYGDIIFFVFFIFEDEDGLVDLFYVLKVLEDIGKKIDSYKVIVDKSMVFVGIVEKVKVVIV